MASLPDSSQLKDINGVSIGEIESRAQPLEDSLEDAQRYRVRSSGGFLAPGESLLARLAEDSAKVAQLRETHEHLASQLALALTQSVEERHKIGLGPDPKVSFDFDYQWTSAEPGRVAPQRITVTHRSYAGAQWSFFRNLEHEGELETEEDRLSWKEDHELWNERFPWVVLKIAGGIGTGIIHYIGKHGFYEGGKTNPYRIDPAVLHWVLSGKPSPQALTALREHCEACIEERTARYEADLQLLAATTPPLDKAERRDIEKQLRISCKEETQGWDRILLNVRAWGPD